MEFLCMEPKPLRFHKTEGANNHIQQSDTFFFARNPIGVSYEQLPTMLTDRIHSASGSKEHARSAWLLVCVRCINYQKKGRNHFIRLGLYWRELPSLGRTFVRELS